MRGGGGGVRGRVRRESKGGWGLKGGERMRRGGGGKEGVVTERKVVRE